MGKGFEDLQGPAQPADGVTGPALLGLGSPAKQAVAAVAESGDGRECQLHGGHRLGGEDVELLEHRPGVAEQCLGPFDLPGEVERIPRGRRIASRRIIPGRSIRCVRDAAFRSLRSSPSPSTPRTSAFPSPHACLARSRCSRIPYPMHPPVICSIHPPWRHPRRPPGTRPGAARGAVDGAAKGGFRGSAAARDAQVSAVEGNRHRASWTPLSTRPCAQRKRGSGSE